MKKLLAIFSLVIIFSTKALASIQDLKVEDAWARSSSNPNKNSAAYMVFDNRSDKDIVITKAIAPSISDNVELHETYLDDKGVHKMAHVDKIVIPSKSKIELKPKHTHIMLMDLKKELKAGDKFTLKIICDEVGEKDVEVEIRQLGK
jgi:copper(I)-binding protein